MNRLLKTITKQPHLIRGSTFVTHSLKKLSSFSSNQQRFYCQACDSTLPPGTPYEDHHLDIHLSNALQSIFLNDAHALEILNFVLDARPNQANVLSKKTAILFGKQKYKEGVECLEKCLSVVPKAAIPSIFEDVICTYENNYHDDYSIRLMKGVFRKCNGEYGMALNEFRYALREQPADPIALAQQKETMELVEKQV